MARLVPPSSVNKDTFASSSIQATVVLAQWRLRHTWGLLLVTCLGMIAAVMLVCAIPLYSKIATIKSLHNVFISTPEGSTLIMHATMAAVSASLVETVNKQLEPLPKRLLSSSIKDEPQFSIQSQAVQILSPKTDNPGDSLSLHGYSMQQAASHIKIIAGRLPLAQTTDLEAAITRETAQELHVHIGSTLTIKFSASTTQQSDNSTPYLIERKLPIHIVCIYTPTQPNDVFWHQTVLEPVLQQQQGQTPLVSFSAIVSNATLLSVADATITATTKNATSGNIFSSFITDLYWYYQLDTSQLTIDNLNMLSQQLSALQNTINNTYGRIQTPPGYPYIQRVEVSGNMFSDYQDAGTLEQFKSRIQIAQIPVTILMFETVALILFFVGMMAELLVEQQRDAIAILRSRGASRLQVLGSFVAQGFGLGFVALLVGPLLALLAVVLLAPHILGITSTTALNSIFADPLATIQLLAAYAPIVVLISIVVLSITAYSAISFNMLTMRRETARSTIRPPWQRLNVDTLAIIVTIVGYGISLYLSGLPNLDAQTRVLVNGPLALIAPLFLVLAGALLLLRVFPLLLRWGATLAAQGRGAAAVLALGQMSRTPQQAVRMMLLLTMASALAIFSLTFTASQTQHVLDESAYQVGADFSGTIPAVTTTEEQTKDTASFTSIRGVTSVTLGYIGNATSTTNEAFPVDIHAVHPETFVNTAIWPNQSVPLASLLTQLSNKRGEAEGENIVPAVVDALTSKRLGLSVGTHFALQAGASSDTDNGIITFDAIAEVQHIPMVADSTEPETNNNTSIHGGILVDFQSYAFSYLRNTSNFLPTNYVWLRTSDNPTLLAATRVALHTHQPQISTLLDRRMLIDTFVNDPLYLDLLGELALAASTALLLALFGNLLASWLNVRNRLKNFVVLRALGMSLRQVTNTLVWEQGITYIAAILLGALFGVLLSATVIPTLVFTSAPFGGTTLGELYALQHILPVQIIAPTSLTVALAILIIICIVTLAMMLYVVARPSPSQILRLNED